MSPSPPKLFLRFFKWFCTPDLHRFIEGDLLELYGERVKESGKKQADFRFMMDVLRLFRPGIIRPVRLLSPIRLDMFKHNLLITWRGFIRNKSAFLINLTGLSTGLACILLIYLWVNDELHVDKLHEQDQQLYQVMHNLRFPDKVFTLGFTPVPLAKAMLEEIPEVEASLAISQPDRKAEGYFTFKDQKITAEGIFAADNYFEVLSFPLLQGNKAYVLKDKNSIVLSETKALEIFRTTQNIIGKSIEWKSAAFEGTFTVSGIFKDLPSNSTAQFDFILPMPVLLYHNDQSSKWYSSHAETLIRLKEGTNIEQFNAKISDFIVGRHNLSSEISELFVQQFSSKYLYNNYENGTQSGGRIAYIHLFALIGLAILLIACINFMNLSTAQAAQKMKEIWVKKTIGAERNALIGQYLGEALLIAFMALFIAVGLVILLLPQFNMITGKSLSLYLNLKEVLTILGIVTLTGIIAGSYPALYLSGFQPMAVLKGNFSNSKREQWIRKGLVVFQFTLSVCFIIGVLIINRQVEFIQSKDIGYEQDNILTFERKGRFNADSSDVFLAELRQLPGVKNASAIYGDFVEANYENVNFSWEGLAKDKRFPLPSPTVDYNFIETMDMEVLEGRSFSRERFDDFSKIMINETAAKMIGLANPVGKTIKFGENDRQIVGVVRDFNLKSLHHDIEPLIFRFGRGGAHVVVKIQKGAEQAAIASLKETYEKFHAGYPFDYTFLDDNFNQLYEAEDRLAALSKYFTILAIIISCLGLLGLTTFTAERRIKEIGIRKVLGASAFEIVGLLSREFIYLILIGIVLAVPLSYWLANNWLNNYAYRVDLHWSFFASAAMFTLFIGWLAVGRQTYKAALMNPVKALRSE